MVIKSVYTFADGRIGTLTKSDKFFKYIDTLNENNEVVKEPVYYYIRKKGTNEVYNEAIDILPFEYEEVTEEEMKKLVPDVKVEPVPIEESEG